MRLGKISMSWSTRSSLSTAWVGLGAIKNSSSLAVPWARIILPIVSYFPMSLIFYGSDGAQHEPRYVKYFEGSELIAGDFLFMRKYVPSRLEGKTVVTNSTTKDDLTLLKERGVKMVITTTPRYDGRYLRDKHDGSRVDRLCTQG
jgi:hypothetical protein